MKKQFSLILASSLFALFSFSYAAVPTPPIQEPQQTLVPTIPVATTPPTVPAAAPVQDAVSTTPVIAPTLIPSPPANVGAAAAQPVPAADVAATNAVPAVTPQASTPAEQASPITQSVPVPVPTPLPLVTATEPTAPVTPQVQAQTPAEQLAATTQPTPAAVAATNASADAKAMADRTPAVAAATATPPAPEEKKEIYLNFDNADLINFIDYIAEVKKLNVLPDKGLEGAKISLTIREPLSIDGAWKVFLTVLEMAGFSVVEAGGICRIIAKDKKLMQPLPAYINVPYDKLPDSDLTIRYVFFLTNLQVGDIEPLLASMLSSPNVLYSQKDMNCFIITDKSYNIKAAARLLQELDQMGLPETVTVLKLAKANAKDVSDLLGALIRKPEGNPLARLLGRVSEGSTEYFSPTTRIIPEERTNSLILLGNQKAIEKVVDFITKNLDTEIKEAESPLHIFELQNIDAKQAMDILKEVTAVPDSATGQAAGKYGSIRGGVKYFRSMNMQVDKDGNRLLVSTADKQDWKLLKRTLIDLDKPQPQIGVESLIVTVDVDDNKELGGQIRNKKHGEIGRNIDFQAANITSPVLETETGTGTPVSLLGDLSKAIIPAVGQTVLTFGKSTNIWAVFNAIKTQTNASVLSQPFITIANKTEATINVGEIRRVISEQQVDPNTKNTTSGFTDKNASTKLVLTPQINLDGIIRMKIHVEIVDFTDSSGNNTTTKSLDTNVTVADGQVLVLGGFVKTKVTETLNKTPILGDIPLLGWFFKYQKREITKQYLFIFLSPTIIKPRQTPGTGLYTKMKMHNATDDIEAAINTKRSIDPVQNWFFNPDKENYSHKVIDYANARYQPTTVDIRHDPYYRAQVEAADGGIDQRITIEEKIDVASAPSTPTATTSMIIEKSEQPLKKQIQLPIVTVEEPAHPTMPLLEEKKETPPAAVSIEAPQQSQPTEIPQSVPPPSPQPAITEVNEPIADQRAKLKNLLVETPMAVESKTPPIPNHAEPVIDDKKRENFKQLIAADPITELAFVDVEDEITVADKPAQKQEQSSMNIDPGKRNVLKEFLAANAARTQPTPPTVDTRLPSYAKATDGTRLAGQAGKAAA